MYKTAAGTEVTLNKKQCEQRRKLVDQINARGFEAVVEEVAYTWFNRICAIRFMDCLPRRVQVASGKQSACTLVCCLCVVNAGVLLNAMLAVIAR